MSRDGRIREDLIRRATIVMIGILADNGAMVGRPLQDRSRSEVMNAAAVRSWVFCKWETWKDRVLAINSHVGLWHRPQHRVDQSFF